MLEMSDIVLLVTDIRHPVSTGGEAGGAGAGVGGGVAPACCPFPVLLPLTCVFWPAESSLLCLVKDLQSVLRLPDGPPVRARRPCSWAPVKGLSLLSPELPFLAHLGSVEWTGAMQ